MLKDLRRLRLLRTAEKTARLFRALVLAQMLMRVLRVVLRRRKG